MKHRLTLLASLLAGSKEPVSRNLFMILLTQPCDTSNDLDMSQGRTPINAICMM